MTCVVGGAPTGCKEMRSERESKRQTWPTGFQSISGLGFFLSPNMFRSCTHQQAPSKVTTPHNLHAQPPRAQHRNESFQNNPFHVTTPLVLHLLPRAPNLQGSVPRGGEAGMSRMHDVTARGAAPCSWRQRSMPGTFCRAVHANRSGAPYESEHR